MFYLVIEKSSILLLLIYTCYIDIINCRLTCSFYKSIFIAKKKYLEQNKERIYLLIC